MRLKVLLIVSLLVVVISAPIVDVLACEDCRDILPLRETQQLQPNGTDHSEGNPLSSDAARPSSKETDAAQDLCPVCANIAAAMDNTCCGAPSMTIRTSHLLKLLALSDPSYSINKPPQN
jgi:hypothetical protein